jgi:hypothetical protein
VVAANAQVGGEFVIQTSEVMTMIFKFGEEKDAIQTDLVCKEKVAVERGRFPSDIRFQQQEISIFC